MDISIWQQFSSNHSSGFTIIGEFATHTEAESAAKQLQAILNTISIWHEQHEEEMQEWWNSGDWTEEPSPPEKELADKYKIDWHGAIDWFDSANVDIVLDRFVYISPGRRPETDGKPFDQIIERLGGRSFHEGNVYGDTTGLVVFDLTCDAPDEYVATAIYKRYLGVHRRIRRTGTHLNFYRWRFEESPDLPTLITELTTQGCTDFAYTFQQFQPDDELYGKGDVDVLIEILTISPDVYERRDAAQALGDIGDISATEALISALQSSDGWLRRAAAGALGKLKDTRAVEPLQLLLSDPDEWTRGISVNALGKIADAKTVEPLIEVLRDNHIWEQAANALGHIGEAAIAPLEVALDAADEPHRNRIKLALERARETVYGGKRLDALRGADEVAARAAFEQALEARDVDTLIVFLSNPGAIRNRVILDIAVDALVELDPIRVIPLLADRVLSLDGKALNALIRIGAPAVDALINMAESHSGQLVRQSALQALSQISDSRAFDLFMKASDSPDILQRQSAAIGLAKIGDSRAVPVLIKVLMRDSANWSLEVGDSILQSIRRLNGQDELVEALIAKLQNPGWMLGHTLHLLSLVGDKRAIEPLTIMLNSASEQTKPLLEATLQKLRQ